LFYDDNEAELPVFAERLLKQRLDIAIWFLPLVRFRQTMARLIDRGISVLTVADSDEDCPGHRYCVEREPAIKDALLSWRKQGVDSVTILQDSQCTSSVKLTLLEKCLRHAAMPHSFANAESLQLGDILASRARQATHGIIFPSSDVAVPFALQDPARFAKLTELSRVLSMDGQIDIPGSYSLPGSMDIVEIDSQSIAKQIVSDLIQSARPRATKPVIFRTKWIPRRIGVPTAFGSTHCNSPSQKAWRGENCHMR
jgi:hypothetical protein